MDNTVVKINKTVTVHLPPEFKKVKLPFFNKWVTALESGKYKKTTGTLCKFEPSRKSNCYCCLGILSKIQGRLIVDEYDIHAFVDGPDSKEKGVLASDNPSYEVLSENGSFPEGVCVMTGDDEHWGLAEFNDNAKVSFNTIAKVIRTIWKA